MNLEILEQFLLYSLLINMGIYTFTALALLAFKDWIYKIHHMFFNLSQEGFNQSMQNYLASYKLLMTFFNFVPWLALLIIK